MFRTAWRNILAHKLRLLMTALAVVCGIAFVSGTLMFGDSYASVRKKAVGQDLEGVSVQVTADRIPGGRAMAEEAPPLLNDKVAKEISGLPGVQAVRAEVSGFSGVVDHKNKLIGGEYSSVGANHIAGTDGRDARHPLLSGRAPTGPGEIAVDQETARKGGFRLGDTVRVVTDGPTQQKKLVGITAANDGSFALGASLTLYDTATAQALFAKPGQFTQITVTAAKGTGQRALADRIQELVPDGIRVETGEVLAAQQAKSLAKTTRQLNILLLGFAGVSLFVGAFTIANTFTMLVTQRTREIALVRAVGATRKQVTRAILAESFLIGVVSSVAGFVLGTGIAVGLPKLINGFGGSLPEGPLVVSPTSLLCALAVGVLVTMAAAWLPARRAARIAPVQALSTVETPAKGRSLAVRAVLGGVLAAVALALLAMGAATRDITGQQPVMAGGFLLLIAAIALTPLLAGPLLTLAGAPLRRIFGICGAFAALNAARNPRRTSATASALMVGLALMTSVTVGALSVQGGLDKMAEKDQRADYVLSTSNGVGLDAAQVSAVAKTPGVGASTALQEARTRPTAAYEYGMPLQLVDPAGYRQLVNLKMLSGSIDGLREGTVLLPDHAARMLNANVGSRIEVPYPDRTSGHLEVAGIYSTEGEPLSRTAVATTGTVTPHLGGEKVHAMTMLVKAAAGAGDLTPALAKAAGDSPLVQVKDRDAMRKDAQANIYMTLNMLYGLLAMSVLIAVLGIVNTLALSVFERTREIGMLRAVGLQQRGVKLMIRLESVVTSLFGAALGIGLGTLIAAFAGQLVVKSFPQYALVIPWGRIGAFLAVALLIGILAALWPARRAARLNPLEAIKAE
ncbi:ABC transporter permease [Streptomyces sp. NPDC048340]|uniref:ABC transporter permease n=1 Tax=Streptomyces sp. NPDC048340 TaxID=3365537 RepID=UPI003720EFFE